MSNRFDEDGEYIHPKFVRDGGKRGQSLTDL